MHNKVMGIEVEKLPNLSTIELENTLIEYRKSGNEKLREQFLLANLRLVLVAVGKFKYSKESPDDLFQVGMLGLIKATDNFDLSLGLKFSTYAVPMIFGEMRRYCREGTAFKVGRAVRDTAFKAVQAREKLEREGKNATLNDIATELNVPYYEVVSALDALAEPQSMYQEVYDDDGGTLVIDLVKDPKSDEDVLEKITLREGVKTLPIRERKVIEMRYFTGATQTEIAKELDISQAQVSRLEKGAIQKLKAILEV